MNEIKARKLQSLAEHLELLSHHVALKKDLGPFEPSIDASMRVIEAEIQTIRGLLK
jgi:hypothetical protein